MKAGRIVYALAQLSERERVLLLLLGLVAVPMAIVFLAVLPLLEARDAARQQAADAGAMLAWVSDQVRALPADAGTNGALVSVGAAIGISEIEESLVQGGLRDSVSQLSNRAEGGVDLALENAEFEKFGQWLQHMAPDWGYNIASFRIEAVSPGVVNAAFELEVAP